MENRTLIHKFYTSFSEGNVEEMLHCYHPDIIFEDPAFGKLKGKRANAMWKMLLSRRKDSMLQIQFSLDEKSDSKAQWVATYFYGPKKKKVINKIAASFEFKDGKIIKHTDYFSLWKWTQQALGLSGYLLGWSSFMKGKIHHMANKTLDKYLMN